MHKEDVIAHEHLETYLKERNIIGNQLTYIKNNLFIIEKITDFPFDLFTDELGRSFWVLTSKALFDSTILAFWTIISDDKGDKKLAIQRFKTRVEREYKRSDVLPEHVAILKKKLKTVKFTKRITDVKIQIDRVRNSHVAHLDYDVKLDLDITKRVEYRIALNDLQDALEITYELFQILTFEDYFPLDYWAYAPRPYAKNFLQI